MAIVPKNYFKPIGRPTEIIVGVFSSAICLFFIALTLWFVYRVYLVGNLLKVPTLIFISVMITFALGFISIAYRLLLGIANKNRQLLSNFFLYFIGIFFLLCSVGLGSAFVYNLIQDAKFGGPVGYAITAFLIGAGSIKLANHRRKKNIQPQFAPDR